MEEQRGAVRPRAAVRGDATPSRRQTRSDDADQRVEDRIGRQGPADSGDGRRRYFRRGRQTPVSDETSASRGDPGTSHHGGRRAWGGSGRSVLYAGRPEPVRQPGTTIAAPPVEGVLMRSSVFMVITMVTAGTLFAQDPPPKPWTSSLGAGLAVTSGNSETQNVNFAYS